MQVLSLDRSIMYDLLPIRKPPIMKHQM